MIYSSEQIKIYPLQERDALKLNKLLVSNTDRFIRYLPKTLSDNTTLELTHNYIKKKIEAVERNKEFIFVIKDKYGIEIIGLVILKNLDWEIKQGEFAYCIDKAFKGKGIVTEAMKALSTYSTEKLGLKTLQIISHKTNSSSVNVAVNSGYKWKKTLMNEFTPFNEMPLDMELYELDDEK